MSRFSYKSLILILLFLLIPIVLFLRINQKGKQVSAEWFNDSWNYRQRVDISNSSGSDLTDFQVSIDIGTSALIAAGKMQSDCDDIRITDQNGNLLPYWIETNGINTCNQTSTKIWVKTPSLPASGAPVYVYYGNSTASAVANGNDVFEFFDDFNGSSIDTSKWTVTGTMLSLASGRIRADIANGTGSMYIQSTFSRPFVLDMDFYPTQYPSGWEGSYHGSIAFGTFNTSNQNEHTWVPYGGGGNSYCGLCDDGGCYHGSYVNPLRVGDTLYNISMKIQPTIAGPQGVMSYTNMPNDGIGSSVSNTVYTAATTGDDPLKIGIKNHNSNPTDDFEWDNWRIRKYASNDPTATPQSEEVGGGPIAYWKFDEGVGTTAYNHTSVSGINGSLVNNPTWKTENSCISGKCLYLDGTNQYITVPHNTSIHSTSEVTVSLWVKSQRVNGKHTFLVRKATPGYGIYYDTLQRISFFVYYPSGSPTYQFCSATNYTLPNDEWTHITGEFKQNEYLKVYINGSEKGSCSPIYSDPIGTGSPSLLLGYQGWWGSDNAYFQGYLDEVKIYPYARTADQIKADYAAGLAGMSTSSDSAVNIGGASTGKSLSDGLVGYWKFDEGVGTTTVDSSGNNNLLTFGTGDSAPSWASGKYGIGTSFNNNSSYTQISNPNNFPTSEITTSFWIKTSDSGDGIISYEKGANEWLIYQSNAISIYRGGGIVNTGIAINDNSWHHVVATWRASDGQTILYVDAINRAQGNISIGTTINSTGGCLVFGQDQDSICGGFQSTQAFNGSLDEVRIYNRALSPTEVKQLYEYAPGPVAYYNFEEGQGTTITDRSGNNFSSTSTTGTPVWVNGKYGTAASFNGSTYSQFPSLGTGSYAGTTSIWINFPANYSANTAISNIGPFFIGSTSANRLNFDINRGGTWVDGSWGTATNFYVNNIPANTWTYVTVTWDSGTAKVFINGILKLTKNYTTGPLTNNGGNWLGHWNNGNNYTGKVDEIKIYNYARTQKQIIEDMNAGASATSARSGPLVHYKFDEGFGSTVINFGNSPNVGTLGVGNSSPTWTEGKIGKALYFNGVDNQLVDITDIPGNLDKFTLSAWVYSENGGDSSQSILASFWEFKNNQICYWSYSFVNQYWRCSDIGSVPRNQWVHLITTWNGSVIQHYVNGKLTWTDTTTTTGTNQTFTSIAGYAGRRFKGKIDEVKIYNYALTADEVKQDYNQGSTFVFGSSNQTIGATTTSLDYCIPGDTSPCSPPVAEWKFEEGVGTTAYDSSGNNNHCFSINSPSWLNGKIGTSLQFNGSSQYLNCGSSSVLDPGAEITLEGWVKLNSNDGNWSSFISKSNKTSYFIMQRDGSTSLTFGAYFSGSGYKEVSIPTENINLNQWYYITATYSSPTLKIYQNGNLISSNNTASGPIVDTTPSELTLGASGPSSQFFNGQLDQVRIYNYARTPAQIAWSYNKGAPVGHWKMDECQGTQIADWSGNANHGTLSIGASGTQTSPGTCTTSSTAWGNGKLGKLNSSLNFDGSDDYIQTPTLTFSDSNPWTFSSWLKWTSGNSTTFYAGKNASTEGFLVYYAGNFAFRDKNGVYYSYVSPSPFHSIFTQVTWVADGSGNLSLYLNGKLAKTTSSVPTQMNFELIGRGYYTEGYNFGGQIDDVRIYNYALTPTQIKTLYNNGSVNFR